MHATVVEADSYVVLRLPSGNHIVTQIKPNATVHIGKYGNFRANDLVGRPFYYTYEVLVKGEGEEQTRSGLRLVSPAELHADFLESNETPVSEAGKETTTQMKDGVQYDILGEDGQLVMRTNREIVDDSRNQTLSMEEIEALKASGTGAGKELIAKLLKSHASLDQKTAFALAKYTLRKTKKFSKRFTVLPLDVSQLARWMYMEKDMGKIMELREETLALIGSWSNVHHTPSQSMGGRWLVVDDTAGLVLAYMAEKMGILLPQGKQTPNGVHARTDAKETISSSNTLTLVHALPQPNLSLLRYFSFDAHNPSASHPLSRHLNTLSWLQLLHPEDDTACIEPPLASPEEISSWKSGRRANYFRKRRRWARIRSTIDNTRAGSFDGLVIASVMNPETILHHLVPLLRGGANVVVYARHVEVLAGLSDLYSTARKSAFITAMQQSPDGQILLQSPSNDFPVDPRLLLAPTIHTVRSRPWQVLPGRTHPQMTGKGGAEGFVFTATRVTPLEGVVQARGKRAPKRKRKLEKKGEGVEVGGSEEEDAVMIDDSAASTAMKEEVKEEAL